VVAASKMISLLARLARNEVATHSCREELDLLASSWLEEVSAEVARASDKTVDRLLAELAAVLRPLAERQPVPFRNRLLGRLLGLVVELERNHDGARRCLARLVGRQVAEQARGDERPLLVINPGQSSTRLSLVRGLRLVAQVRLHGQPDRPDNVEERARQILEQLQQWEVQAGQVAGITGRSGFLAPVPPGYYRVVPRMLEDLQSPRGRPGDEMSLPLLLRVAAACGQDSGPLVVTGHPLSCDERDEVELLSGMTEIERLPGPIHALNHLSARRLVSSWLGDTEQSCALLSAHLGSAGSLARHRQGRLAAVVDAFSGVPSTNHCGNVDTGALLQALEDNRLNLKDVHNAVYQSGGLLALAGTNDFRALLSFRQHGANELQRRKIELLLDFFARRIAAGLLALAADGHRVRAVAITGGVTQVRELADRVENNLAWRFPLAWLGGTLADEAMAAALITCLHRPGYIADYQQAVTRLQRQREAARQVTGAVLFDRPLLYRKPGAPIASTNELLDAARLAVHDGEPPQVALVGADNEEALLAARWAGEEGRFRIARFLLVGDSRRINELAYELDLAIDDEHFVVVDTDEPVATAVELLNSGQAAFLMKGSVKTEQLMHGALRGLKQGGRLARGTLVSHAVAMDLPRRQKLLMITDAAINPYPDESKKIAIIENALRVARCLNISRPQVAVISAIESVNPGIESSIEAERIAAHFAGRDDCVVEGPLSFDVATDAEIAAEKHYAGHLAGSADILLMPDIDSANVLYKTLTTQSGAVAAGVTVCGDLPLVLTSRGDSARSKLASIALAVRFLLQPRGDAGTGADEAGRQQAKPVAG